MTFLRMSSFGSPTSSPRANSELSAATTTFRNEAQSWGGGGGCSPWHYYYCDQRDVPGTDIWKYVDDTSFSETINKNQDSHIQAIFFSWTISLISVDMFLINVQRRPSSERWIHFMSQQGPIFNQR